MKFIKQDEKEDKSKRYIYFQDGNPTIILNKGPKAFEDCIEYLQKCSPKHALEYDPTLNILIPDDKNYWAKSDHLLNLITLKKSEIKNCEENAFHFDIGSYNPEISFILQLVDDNSFNGIRRSNLLNDKFKYIGISYKMSDSICCSYYFLSDFGSLNN